MENPEQKFEQQTELSKMTIEQIGQELQGLRENQSTGINKLFTGINTVLSNIGGGDDKNSFQERAKQRIAELERELSRRKLSNS